VQASLFALENELLPNSHSLFSSPLLFVFLFVVLILIIVTNFFQAILIHGYQCTLIEVDEDEGLRGEQRELVRRAQKELNSPWLQRQVRNIRDWFRYRERDRIISRLSTAPERRYRSLLSYSEVLCLLNDDVVFGERADEVAEELVLLYEARLSRIKDSFALFCDTRLALMEGRHANAELTPDQLPLIVEHASALAPGEKNAELVKFDPRARDNWIRDLRSGNTLQSMFFVHCLQMEKSTRAFDEQMQAIDEQQRAIQQKQIELEESVTRLELSSRQRQGDGGGQDTNAALDPWAARASSAVEPRVDGRFDAHHVDQETK
jgi:hypothetical protein